MRILVIDEEIPYPLNTGKKLRTYNLLKQLSNKHEITFICQQYEGSDYNAANELKKIGIKPIVVDHKIRSKSGFKFYLALFLNLFSKHPYSVSSHHSKQLISKIEMLLKDQNFDLIHCEWTPYAINLNKFFKYPTVVAAHNVEAQIWKRNYQVEKNILKKIYIFFQWKKMQLFEKKMFPRFSHVVTVSNEDSRLISDYTRLENISVVPNGVDTNYFFPAHCQTEEDILVFTGSMDWRPNVDGVVFFLDQIWPLILKNKPLAKFYIVGRSPDKVLVKKVQNKNNIFLTGTVDDVRPYINKASIFIVPLRFGGGSRLKILEACAMKKAVISTTIGAEGLQMKDRYELMISDDPCSFAEAVTQLLNDSKTRSEIAKNGFNLVHKKYKWSAISSKLNLAWGKAKSKNVKL